MATKANGKIEIENVNDPGKAQRVDGAMYQAMKRALLKVVPKSPQGLTLAEIGKAVRPHLPEDLYPGGAKAGWWLKAVQLDLEAKGIIKREKVSPIGLRRA